MRKFLNDIIDVHVHDLNNQSLSVEQVDNFTMSFLIG